jgi:hypothetical protein
MSEVKKREDDVKKYTQVPMKGGWEIPRKLFHFSIGKENCTNYYHFILKMTAIRIPCIIPLYERNRYK